MKRWMAAGALALATLGAAAQSADAEAEAPLKEIQVAPEAFQRGTPVPAWADLLPLPPEDPALAARPMVVRLADSHLRAGPPSAYLVNRAEQARDASALGAIGQATLSFNPAYQTMRLHRVQIVRGSEVVDHTKTVSVRFLQRETGLEQGIYSGQITVNLVLPDVRIGDTLHLVYSVEGSNPILGQRFADASSWEQAHPTQVRRVTLTAPAGRNIRWQWIGGLGALPPAPVRSEEAGQQRWRFEQRGLAAAEFEPYMPVRSYPARWLQFSEFGSWGEVAEWARTLFPADAPLPPSLAPVLERLRALPTPEARVSQALQWVQGEIRYWSVALGEGSHRPALPAEVVQRRWGDCKDKTLLLVQMLRALGIAAEPALASLSTRAGTQAQLPSPLAFDHVIARVTLGGRTLYLDPTRLGQTGTPQLMGQALEGAAVLPLDAAALAVISSPERERIFTSELTERFRLDSFTGEGRLEAEQVWVGLQAEALRLVLPGLVADKRRQWALSAYERRYPGIRLDGEPELRDDPEANRLVSITRYAVPQLVREYSDGWMGRFFPSNFQGSFALPEQVQSRRFPLALPAWPATLRYTVEMQWPESVSVVADPSTQRVDTPHFRLEVQHSFRGNRLRRQVVFEPLVPDLPAAELPRLMGDLEKFDRAVGGTLAVGKAAVKSGGLFGLGRSTLQDQMRKRLESNLERTGKVIAAGTLTGDDLAEALCTRAELRSDLGDPAAGLPDAQEALKVAPGLPRALRCRGSLHWHNAEFAKAAADYTQALAVADDAAGVLHRRGQARFYDGRLEAALSDFEKAAAQSSDDGERQFVQLWQALTLARLQRPLPPALQAKAAQGADGDWPRPALALLAGLRTPEQVLATIDRRLKGDERELALAEAWFYIGQWHRARGADAAAREAFEKARAQGITMYVEHVASGFELRQLPR
jgi:transglutaminase-like putative cysteine protease/lipoprotein NlpI